MKIALRNHGQRLASYLSTFKSAALSYDDPSRFHPRLLRLHIPFPVLSDLRHIDLGFLFQYDVFPPNILNFFGEWQLEKRELRTGDTIVQQAHLPPGAFGLKFVFAVRVISAYRTEDRAGFEYGTLIGHPEKGTNEFYFSIEKGALFATVRTMAISGLLLTRLLWPLVTRPYADFCNSKALLHMRDEFLKHNFAETTKQAAKRERDKR